jgi:hypothetical protein
VPVVSMSKKEFDRLEVLLGIQSGRLRVANASNPGQCHVNFAEGCHLYIALTQNGADCILENSRHCRVGQGSLCNRQNLRTYVTSKGL